MRHIKPTKGRLVIAVIQEANRVSRGGIVLPNSTSQSNVQVGKVEATDEIDKLGTNQVAVGDTVFFERFTAAEVELDGNKLFLVKEEDVLGIIKEKK